MADQLKTFLMYDTKKVNGCKRLYLYLPISKMQPKISPSIIYPKISWGSPNEMSQKEGRVNDPMYFDFSCVNTVANQHKMCHLNYTVKQHFNTYSCVALYCSHCVQPSHHLSPRLLTEDLCPLNTNSQISSTPSLPVSVDVPIQISPVALCSAYLSVSTAFPTQLPLEVRLLVSFLGINYIPPQ